MSDLTYPRYLELDQLLDLQHVRSDPPEHDEMLFIVIHQVYELWFKLLLHELEKVESDFQTGSQWGAHATLGRCRTILKTLVGQLDILETMTPRSFNSFRERLETSSGFQSVQFREIETFLGYKRPGMLEHWPEHLEGLEQLKARLAAPTLRDAFHQFLVGCGAEVPQDIIERDVTQPSQPDDRVQEALFQLYTDRPDLIGMFETMIDLDEGFMEWRYRHVQLVSRTIGTKEGTGGSLGVEFLKKSLFHPFFPDLWAIRHRF